MLKNEIVIERDPEPALRPRWLRISTVLKVYSLSTVRLYQLLNAGELKSIVIKDRGKKRGIRLINAESLEEYFNQRSSTKLEPMQVLAYNPDNPVRGGRPRKNKEVMVRSGQSKAKEVSL
ncbi:MAG: hypothetical protein WB586_03145 [Chthoniobacterales bacterium]